MKNRSRQTYDGLTALSALRSKLDTDQDSDEYHNIDFALQSLEYEYGSITILVDDTYIDEKVSSYLIAKRRPSVRNIRVIEQTNIIMYADGGSYLDRDGHLSFPPDLWNVYLAFGYLHAYIDYPYFYAVSWEKYSGFKERVARVLTEQLDLSEEEAERYMRAFSKILRKSGI